MLTVVGYEFDRVVNLLPSLFSVLLTEYVLKHLQLLHKKGEKEMNKLDEGVGQRKERAREKTG